MNGRVYDPLTAQFFSPDPFIQEAGNWQNYNRYSYVFNNPLIFTDPSGYRKKNQHEQDIEKSWNEYSYVREPGTFRSVFNYSKGGGGYTYDNNTHLYRDQYGFLVGYNEVSDKSLIHMIDIPNSLQIGYKIAQLKGWVGTYDEFIEIFNGRSSNPDYNGIFTLHTWGDFPVAFGVGRKRIDVISIVLGRNTSESETNLNNDYQFNSPESEIVTTASSIAGLYVVYNKYLSKIKYPIITSAYGTLPVLKGVKYAGFLGPTGDAISVLGAIWNLSKDQSFEHFLDLTVAVIGFVPGYGDALNLFYMVAKWHINETCKAIEESNDNGAQVLRSLEILSNMH